MDKIQTAFRIGNSAQVPSLQLGVPGWDADTKTARVGDDTATPPRMPTTKSRGTFEFPDVDAFRLKELRLFPNGKVDGVTPSKLNPANKTGFVRLISNNTFQHVGTNTDHFKIEADTLSLSDAIVDLIEDNSGVSFSYGDAPPTGALPGHLFWSTFDGLLYIRLTDNEDGDDWWLDVSSIGGGRNSGISMHVGPTPPLQANIGDYHLDTEDKRIYIRLFDENGQYWRETRV